MVMAAAICSPRSPASRPAKGSRKSASERAVSRARNTAAHRAVSEMLRISGAATLFRRQRGVALRLELVAGLPFRHRILLRDHVTDAKERANILHTAREIPVLLHLVGRLMIILARVLVALAHAIAVRLADEVEAGVGVERRDALLRKLEMVGAVIESLLGLSVGAHRAAIRLQNSRQRIVERRVAEADDREVVRAAPLVDSVHVDVRGRLRQRVQRMLGIVLRADEPLLLRRDGEEQNRAARGRWQLRVRGGDIEQRRAAARVVRGAVEDLIAFERRVLAEVIPMRRVDDVFVLLVAALDLRDDVLRLNLAVVDLDVEVRLGAEGNGLELFLLRGGFQRIEVESRIA